MDELTRPEPFNFHFDISQYPLWTLGYIEGKRRFCSIKFLKVDVYNVEAQTV